MENIENTEKKELMEKYIVAIIKNYRGSELTVQPGNRMMITRNGIRYDYKAFYHFDFNEFTVMSSFWMSNKKWNTKTFNL